MTAARLPTITGLMAPLATVTAAMALYAANRRPFPPRPSASGRLQPRAIVRGLSRLGLWSWATSCRPAKPTAMPPPTEFNSP
jgi:hypothetical protein